MSPWLGDTIPVRNKGGTNCCVAILKMYRQGMQVRAVPGASGEPRVKRTAAMADYLPQLFLAWSIQFMGVMSPGPGVALILGVATGQGRLPAIITALGVASASGILAVATVLGLAAIFATMAELMTVVRFVGAGYLLWLAYKAFRKAASPPPLDVREARFGTLRRTWLTGFALQLSNPKAIFFWLAITSVGGVGDAQLPIVALFVAGAMVISFVGHGAYALLLSSAPVRRVYARFRGRIEAALGCFFLFAGYKLATARL